MVDKLHDNGGVEKDVFLKVLSEELDKIKDDKIKEIVNKKAKQLFTLVFILNRKGLIDDPKEIKRRLKYLIEEE